MQLAPARWVAQVAIILALRSNATVSAPIPDDAKKVVAFIYVEDGNGVQVPNGTGFFVGVPVEGHPDRDVCYLVTAKHVLTIGDGGPWLPRIFLRLDKRDGGTDSPLLPLISSGRDKNIFTATDPTVDIAVIPALPDEKVIDFKILPIGMITSQEDFPTLRLFKRVGSGCG
jgi:hypothetical protein